MSISKTLVELTALNYKASPPGSTTSNTLVVSSREAAVNIDVGAYVWVHCLKYYENGPLVHIWYQVTAGTFTAVGSRPTGVLNSTTNTTMTTRINNLGKVQFANSKYGQLYIPAGDRLSPQHFGAYGDVVNFNFAAAHDDTVAMQNAFDYAVYKSLSLRLGGYSYRLTDTLYLGWDVDMTTATNKFSGASIIGEGISSQGGGTMLYFFPTGGVNTGGMIECRNTAWSNLKLEDFYCVGLTDTSSNPYAVPAGDVYPYQYGIVHIDQYFTGWTYRRANVKNARNCYAILGQSFTANGEFTLYDRCDGVGQKFFYMADGIGFGVGQAYGQYFHKCSFGGGFNGNASSEYVAFDVGNSAGGYILNVVDFDGSVNTVYTAGTVTPRNYIFLRTRGVGSFRSVGGRVEGLSTLVDVQSGIGDRIVIENMDFAGLFTTPECPLIKATSSSSVHVRISDSIIPMISWHTELSSMNLGMYITVPAMDSSNFLFERCNFQVRKDMSSVSQGIKVYPFVVKRSARPYSDIKFVDCYGIPSVNGYAKYKFESNSTIAAIDADKAGVSVKTGIPYNKILKPFIVDITQNSHQASQNTLTITTTANSYTATCANTSNAAVGYTLTASTLTGKLFVITSIVANTSITFKALDGTVDGSGIAAGSGVTATLGISDSQILPWLRGGSDYSFTSATRPRNSWTTPTSGDLNARTLFFAPGTAVYQVLNSVSASSDVIYFKAAIGVSSDNVDNYIGIQLYNTATGIVYDEARISGQLNDTASNRVSNLDFVSLSASHAGSDVTGSFAVRLYSPTTNSGAGALTVQLAWMIASEKVDGVPHSYPSYSPSIRTFGPTSVNLTTTLSSAVATTTSTSNLAPGMTLSGNGNIPGGTTILSVDSSTQITLSTGVGVTAGTSVATSCTNSKWIQFQSTPKSMAIAISNGSTYINGHPDLPANTNIVQGDNSGAWYQINNSPTTASGPSSYTSVYLTRRDARSWATAPQFKAFSRFALPHREDYSDGLSSIVTNSADQESDMYLSLNSERVTYYADQKYWQIPRVSFASSMPTSGYWTAQDYVLNTSTALQSNSVAKTIKGWLRITTGTGNVLGTDWVADFIPTVHVDTTKYKETATTGPLTIPNNVNTWIFKGAGSDLTATIPLNFPAAPIDGQLLKVVFSVGITSLTTSGNGSTVKAGLSAAAVTAGSAYSWIYDLADTTWYRT